MNELETREWARHLFGEDPHDGTFPIPTPAGEVDLSVLQFTGNPVTSVMTVGVSRWDQNLITDDGKVLRSELVGTFSGAGELMVTGIVNCAAAIATGRLSPTPGTILEDVFLRGGAPIHHALVAAPFIWDRGVPRVTLGQTVTTLLQVVPLTEEERRFGQAAGIPLLWQRLGAVDLNDVLRPSAVS